MLIYNLTLTGNEIKALHWKYFGITFTLKVMPPWKHPFCDQLDGSNEPEGLAICLAVKLEKCPSQEAKGKIFVVFPLPGASHLLEGVERTENTAT